MARTHAQQFANHTLVDHVYADPLAFVRSLASDAAGTLGALWEQAGTELAPIARVAGAGFAVKSETLGLYTIAVIELPAPRESGDPVAVAVIGRGDGTTKLGTIGYYTLELAHDVATGALSFSIFALTRAARARASDGPLPDLRWFAEHVSELYGGQLPGERTGVPAFPGWYWWYAFDGTGALKLFNEAREESARIEAVRKAPILLLPEIVTAVEIYSGTPYANKLRDVRSTLRRDPEHAATWHAVISQVVNARKEGHPVTNIALALSLIAEVAEHGAFTKVQALELEATMLSKLASLGVDPHENYMRAEQLYAAAHEAANPRARRASIAPGPPLDPTGQPLFLDETDLPDHVPAERNDTFALADPTFLAHGGLHAGFVTWASSESSGLARFIDARWVFRTTTAATYFLHAVAPVIGEGLPRVGAPSIGDETLAFGDDSGRVRRSHVIAFRVGRIVARLQAIEGADAAAARQILHAQMIYPLAGRAVKRAGRALLAYWLIVEYPTNTIATLVHTPGHDVSRLLAKYPLLALPELPEAIRLRAEERQVIGGKEAAKDLAAYTAAADTLRNFQTQVRAHRWPVYRDAMRALTRALLETDMGDPRVNAAYAHEIVSELRHLDPDPIWAQLDALCLARG